MIQSINTPCFGRVCGKVRRYGLPALICFAVAICFQSSAVAQQSTLRWEFKTGDQFQVQQQQQNGFVSKIGTRDRQINSDLTVYFDWNVTDVDQSGAATINQTLTRLVINSGAPGEKLKNAIAIDIDAATIAAAEKDKKTALPRLPGISGKVLKRIVPLVGLTWVLKMGTDGKISSIDFDKPSAAAFAKLPSDDFTKVLDPQALKPALAKGFALPARKLTADDSWKVDDQTEFSGGKVERETMWSVESLTDDLAKLKNSVTAKQQGEFEANPETAAEPMNLKGYTGSGELIFDRKAKFMRSRQVETELKSRTLYRTDKIDTTMKSSTRTTVTKKE